MLHIDSEKSEPVDLKVVYTTKNENNQTKIMFENGESICSECLDSVPVRNDFIKQEKEEISGKKMGETYLIHPCVKTEEIEIKQEELIEELIPVTVPFNEIKKEEDEEGNELLHFPVALMYRETGSGCSVNDKSDKNNINPNFQDSVESRESKQHNTSETQLSACYSTECKCKDRRLVHMDTAEVQIYKCDECQFETECSYSLKSHQSTHKKVLMYTCDCARMYKCDICPFETRNKRIFKFHELKHKDPSKMESFLFYKCYSCNFVSKHKNRVKSHMLMHEDPSTVQMYKCDKCKYESKLKDALRQHMLVHKDPSEVQMYKCDKCKYESRHKNVLKAHMLRHKDSSEVQMHNCYICKFETRYKYYLKKHMLRHKDVSEVQIQKCDKCKFETKHKSALKQHMRIHSRPSKCICSTNL